MPSKPVWLDSFSEKMNSIFFKDKPFALPFGKGGWKDWEEQAKKKSPLGYFLADTFPDLINDYVLLPYHKFNDGMWWLRYRIGSKYTYFKINTGLEPGYYDADTRMLYGMFSLLVDYIEVERAWQQRLWNTPPDGDEKPVGFFERWNLRDAEAGLRYIDWETKLDDPSLPINEQNPHQAQAAREILALYKWWKAYEDRPDIHDASGWSAWCDKLRDNGVGFLEDDPNETAEDRAEKSQALSRSAEIEEAYEKEDEEMLIRLIKIRRSLWT